MPRKPRAPGPGVPVVVDVLDPNFAGTVIPPNRRTTITANPPASATLTVTAERPPTPVRPAPEHQLTPEQRRIRDLEHQLALERGRKDPEQELELPEAPGANGNIVIHFIADGHTALGQVWRRGQELEFDPNGPAYADTVDRFGWSWLELRDRPAEQEARWGEVKFRSGPWPGKSYTEVAKERFDIPGLGPTEDELRRAEAAEARRNRAVPRLPAN